MKGRKETPAIPLAAREKSGTAQGRGKGGGILGRKRPFCLLIEDLDREEKKKKASASHGKRGLRDITTGRRKKSGAGKATWHGREGGKGEEGHFFLR